VKKVIKPPQNIKDGLLGETVLEKTLGQRRVSEEEEKHSLLRIKPQNLFSDRVCMQTSGVEFINLHFSRIFVKILICKQILSRSVKQNLIKQLTMHNSFVCFYSDGTKLTAIKSIF
jgi:hypothetical protein